MRDLLPGERDASRGQLWLRVGSAAIFCLAFLAGAVGLLIGYPWAEGVTTWLGGGGLLLVFAAAYAVMTFIVLFPSLRRLRPQGGPGLLSGAAALLPLLGLVIAWGVVGAGVFARRAEQRRAVAELADLLRRETPPRDAEPLARHGKALIWDLDKNDCRPSHQKLPDAIRVTSAEGPLTVFAVVWVTKEETGKYSSGEMGYRQDAVVSVATWPDRKALGTYTVRGYEPGVIVFREHGEKGPVLGDIEPVLTKWVAELPDADSDAHREALGQWRRVQELRPRFGVAGELPPTAAVAPKLLVWDMAANRPSPVQELLPPERRARSSDERLTVAAVLSAEDVPAAKYGDGSTGYRRDVTVSLVTWPDKVDLGRHVVRGDDPPLIAFGGDLFGKKESAVYGEHQKPLAAWLTQLPIERGDGGAPAPP